MTPTRRPLNWLSPGRAVLLFAIALLLFVALFPSVFWSLDPNDIDATSILQAPSAAHPLGTDEVGSDVLARLLHATGLDLAISFGSVVVALLIAVPAGLLAGYTGKATDETLSAVSNAILAFPVVLFAILLVASFGPSLPTLIGVLGFVFIPRFFQLVRGQTLSLREREFVTAAHVAGVSESRVLWRHILPNLLGPLAVMIPQLMAVALLAEAALSFLGLGVQPPGITWGTMLLNSKNYYATAPWYAITPGVVVTLVAAVMMFAGDAVAAAVNPTRRPA